MDKCGGAADIVLVIIDAADNRDADYNLSGQMLQPFHVFQNFFVGNAGVFLMCRTVDMLEVHENQVHALQRFSNIFKLEEAAGLDRHAVAQVIDMFCKVIQKFRLPGGFAA